MEPDLEAAVVPTPYRITVRGRPSPRVMTILEPLRLESEGDGRTTFVGDIVDQSHLYGVIGCLERHEVELVSIVPLARTASTLGPREVSA